ncbi:hypothetical protein DID77_01100 [Candidatus Marinamargulisbacteria bacterium SCGC AG-439-L15]|nr:hypothetical protein DID77_01100 [Candidatus Marinamargulisbacteria bacterium SCGC AG-439-L15]
MTTFFRQYKFSILIILIGILTYFTYPRYIHIKGQSMGTTYEIKAYKRFFFTQKSLASLIDKRLTKILGQVSHYEKDSQLSQFNRGPKGRPMTVGDDFWAIIKTSERLYNDTEGLWDPTAEPLIAAWGFSSAGRVETPPSQLKLNRLLDKVGFRFIYLYPKQQVEKKKDALRLNFAAIAKGYAVDAIAELLESQEIDRYYVEIGGEVRVGTSKSEKNPWRLGIQDPRDTKLGALYGVVSLENKAMATSGDYRQFFEWKGKRYNHVMNAKTGWPSDNGVVSVTVIANTCMLADGLATAIMILGPEKGLALLTKYPHTDALILQDHPSGVKAIQSPGFKRYLNDKQGLKNE